MDNWCFFNINLDPKDIMDKIHEALHHKKNERKELFTKFYNSIDAFLITKNKNNKSEVSKATNALLELEMKDENEKGLINGLCTRIQNYDINQTDKEKEKEINTNIRSTKTRLRNIEQ